MIKTIKTQNPSFSLPSRHHHKGQLLFTISSHLRRRVCCRHHTGNVPSTSLALHGKLLLALLVARASCCTRVCAASYATSARWLLAWSAHYWQCVLRATRCCRFACSALLLATYAAGRALLAAVKISSLRRSDLPSVINLQIY